jgi:hypothetical protein
MYAGIAVVGLILSFVRPYVHVPSADEKRVIRAATQQYLKTRNGMPSSAVETTTQARWLGHGRWQVVIIEIYVPGLGGLRHWYFFSVDEKGRCEFVREIEGGSFP